MYVHLKGHGCPKCNRSKGELKISKLLDKLKINYIEQYSFNNCKNIYKLKFDFYLPNKNTCIEYDGIQHFKPIEIFGGEKKFCNTKKRDKIKTEYCKSNKIKLLRITVFNLNNIEAFLKVFL